METTRARALILLILLLAWEVALFDAYHFAIENRRRDATRVHVEIAASVRGCDAQQNNNFEELTVAKNLSRVGACLFLSKKVAIGTQLDVEFEEGIKSRGRVVWQRESGNHGQCLVGLELLTPLKESSLIGTAVA